ncbi:glycosyltransferase [Sulfurisoma sediminicola]|uniref:glycosyltransferase n=1 Tax=Sulfurisoma sediminicola TaxID=1381557 RepID=UPI0014042941|nr:glycosyltransferase [Sulfurisoma sediminicola]
MNRQAAGDDFAAGVVANVEDAIRRAGVPCTVCFEVPVATAAIEALLASKSVASVVLPGEDDALAARHPGRVGWYVDSPEVWRLPGQLGRDLILVGDWSRFGFRAAISALRAGIAGLHCLASIEPPRRLDMRVVVARKFFDSMVFRFLHQFTRRFMSFGVQEWRFENKAARFARLLNGAKNEAKPLPATKILFVAASLGPGGSERQLCNTLLGLRGRGLDQLELIHEQPMRHPHDFYLQPLLQAGIRCERVRPIFARGASERTAATIDRHVLGLLKSWNGLGVAILAYVLEFRDRRPDVVHSWLDHTNVAAGLAALIAGVPRVVLGCRSMSPRHFAFYQPFMRPIYRLLAGHSNVVFLNNSEAGARDYAAWLGVAPERMRVVRNGFDFDAFPTPSARVPLAQEYRQRHGIDAAALVVGTVMRLSEEKRPLLWMAIAVRVAREVPAAAFLVVGDGPLRKSLEQAVADAGLSERFRFTGHERKVVAALAAMDAFLLTSRVEGLPNVLVEAQAMGVPVVTVDVGGAGETLDSGKTGWLMDSDDPETIARALVSVLQDPAWRARAAMAGRDHALARFGQGRMIDETLQSYGSPHKADAA